MVFRVGRGLADITGEAAGCGMLGYGKAKQQTAGLHLRLRSRAFVIVDADENRVLLVVNELPLPMDSVTQEVLRRLAARYGDLYREPNVMITATHTHCAPGGYSHHLTYNSNTRGFRPVTFEAIVAGTVEAIAQAHDDVAPATLTLAIGQLHGASTNRSRTSFERNPPEERAHFPDAVDPQTTLLRVERDGRLVGVLNWFATHGTSMSNTNQLISSDNKGYAAYHWERLVRAVDHLADHRAGRAPDFVAAFAQTNAGDMSPNLAGTEPSTDPSAEPSAEPSTDPSTVPSTGTGRGPTDDEFENTRLIGLRQYQAAADLAREPARTTEALDAIVDARLTYVDLGDVEVAAEFTGDGRAHRTGRAVAAAAQLAGTDEGPGFAGFRQGRNPVWDALSERLVYPLSRRLREAHAPKAIVLPAWLINRIHPMVAERVPVQLIRIGGLYLLGVPGEVTIVAGLRLRRTVAQLVGAPLDHVLVAGYANAYIHYVTTPEEYDAQRYEAGSTMFGRWELGALQQTAAVLARAMVDGVPVPAGPTPPDLSGRQSGRRRTHRSDEAGRGGFGRVITEPRDRYGPGDRVTAVFVGAHLGNDLHRGDTFLEVQRDDTDADHDSDHDSDQQEATGGWVTVADDGDWSTRLRWVRVGRAGSRVTVTWDVPPDVRPGWYRIVYRGDARDDRGRLRPFTGTSAELEVA